MGERERERERESERERILVNANIYYELIVCIGVIIVIETRRFVNNFENVIEHFLIVIKI